jgi:hypothetical protein
MLDIVWLPKETTYGDVVEWLQDGDARVSFESEGLLFDIIVTPHDYIIVDENGRY